MSGFLLHLLRHGACETPGLMMGRTDGKPTPAGVAACVARAADLAVEAVVSSDLIRSQRAAEAIGQALALPRTIDPRWRELDFGEWDGLASGQIDRQQLGAFWDDPDANPPPGGERWSALVARVGTAIADLPPRPTLVVTHGGAIRAALSVLCGFDHRLGWAFDLPYASLLSLRVWADERRTGQIVGLRT